MKDQDRTKEQLIGELAELRRRVAELDAAKTELERVEEALRTEKEFTDAALDAQLDTFFLFEPASGKTLRWNRAFRDISGYSDEEIARMPAPTSYYGPEDMERAAIFIQKVLEEGAGTIDLDLICKDGRKISTEYRVSVVDDDQGEPKYFISIGRDITERKRAEDALRESEERLRLIAENVTDVIWIADMSFRFTYASPSVERLRGYTAGEVMAQSLDDVLTPASLVRAMELLEDERENIERGKAQPRTVEFEFKCKDGSTVQTESTVSVLYDENRIPIGILGNTRDITERMQAEEAVRESEERFRNIVESIPMGMHMYELQPDGPLVFVGANRTADEILGVDNDQFVGKTIKEAFPALAETEVPDRYRDAASSGEPWQTDQVDYEEGQISGAFAVHAFQTSPGRMVAAFQDITERKRAEEERGRLLAQIRAQAQRMEQVLDTVPEGVLLLDADERIILVNPVAEGELAFLSDARIGDMLTHLGDRPLAELLTSPPKGLWHEVTAADRIFQVIARPIENGPTPAGWVLVIRDVTQQREVQRRVQQQERLAAVGQLAAGIAHDFNNVMATVVLYSQMTARMEGLPDTVRERMETIDGQAKHATNLIQQILDFSRRAVLERRPLDLAMLLKQHVELLGRTLPESVEITLECKPDERDALFTVNADPTRMQQMVTNLALNAREAMPQGGELRIGLELIEIRRGESPLLPEMAPGEWIAVTVSDTGTGIPPDVLPRIFEPFFTTRAPLGSGLGLAQVHGIVGQHGGRIDVETRVGKGTTFTIYLPAHRLEPSPAPSHTEFSALPKGQGETILVVEDDAVVRRALADGLELLNYGVLEVSNGQEALEALEQRQEEIALVLSDVVMPKMSGTALLHALRERGLTVQVVMLSGHPVEREMEELREKGMVDWLSKPPELDQLAEAVARALGTDPVLENNTPPC